MNNYIIRKAHWQAFFSEISQIELLVVNFMLKLNSKYDKIFPSQANIAMWTGCSRKTINKILKKLHDLKWIEKIYRHRKSCIYKISTRFNTFADLPEARKILPGLVNYYYKLILGYFNGPGKRLLELKVTPYKEENKYSNSNSVSVSKEPYSLGGEIDKILNKNIKKEEKSMAYEENFPMTPILREITNKIGLTKWGQIRLTIYAEAALQATLDKYEQGIYNKDIFLWFETHCHGISIKNNYPINLELYDTMKKRYRMPDDAKWIKSKNTYQNQETFLTKNASIIPSERNNSIVGKYKEINPLFADFPYPGDN